MIDLQYCRVGSFFDGLVWVVIDDGMGYINEVGIMVI